MSDQEVQLKRIQEKIQLLLKQHAALQKENLQLKEELANAREQAAAHQQAMDTLKQQVDILKFSTGDMNEAEKKDFEKRVNAYLREIDRCIALLSE